MKKEISLRISMKEQVKLYLGSCIDSWAHVLSFCLDEKISRVKSLRILHAIVAFTVLVFSHTYAWLSVIFLVWFALTLLDCKRMK